MSSENLWKPLAFDVFRWLNRNRTLAWNGLTVDLKVLTSRIQQPMPRVHSLASSVFSVQRPTSRVQPPDSRVQHPESSVQSPESRVQSPESRVQRPESSVQSPASRVERPQSSVELSHSETKNSGMPVCPNSKLDNFEQKVASLIVSSKKVTSWIKWEWQSRPFWMEK